MMSPEFTPLTQAQRTALRLLGRPGVIAVGTNAKNVRQMNQLAFKGLAKPVWNDEIGSAFAITDDGRIELEQSV